MDVIVKLNAQTAGRDKVARLFQYATRVVWHRLQQNNKDGVDNFKNLEFQLSSFRKLLRFGKCVDTIYSILPLLQHKDQTVKVTVILGKMCNAAFLLVDHILWLGRSDLCTINTDKWGRMCSQYWLYSLGFNLLRDLYEIMEIIKARRSDILPCGVNNVGDVLKAGAKALMCVQQNKTVMIDVVKNACDFFLPLTALGYVKFTPGTVGMLGVVSSLAGLAVLIDPSVKLSP